MLISNSFKKGFFMSHFVVIVTGENFEENLAPFNEGGDEFCVFNKIDESDWELFQKESAEHAAKYKNFEEWVTNWHGASFSEENKAYGYFSNPNAKWDWYVLGGRWENYFCLKKNVLSNYPNKKIEDRIYADMAKVKDIDFEAMQENTTKEANLFYDKLEAALNGRKLVSWKETRENYKNIDEARLAFHNHPVNQDLDKAGIFCMEDPVDVFKNSREEYILACQKSVAVPFALLHEGQWHEKGEMGWFGTSTDKMTTEQWQDYFWSVINSLDKETVLCAVDCHI